MSRLKAIDPKAAEPSKPKIVVFGRAGIGKTWTALDFPSVYYIDTEGGANREHYTAKLVASGGAYLGPEQGSLSFDTLLDQMQALATEQHRFRTLVVDSISKLYNIAASDAAERIGDDYGRDRKEANKPMRRLMAWLPRLDMNVILIAHEKPLWGLNAKGERAEIGQTFDCFDKLEYDLDLVLRIVRIGKKRMAEPRKTRLLGFPEGELFAWNYPDFATRYGRDVMERDARPLVLAKPEQLAEMNRLLAVVRLTEGQVEKWFTKANVASFEEMDTDTIGKCIAYMRAKVAVDGPSEGRVIIADNAPKRAAKAKANGAAEPPPSAEEGAGAKATAA